MHSTSQVIELLRQLPHQSAALVEMIDFRKLSSPEVAALARQFASLPLAERQTEFAAEISSRLLIGLVQPEPCQSVGGIATVWMEIEGDQERPHRPPIFSPWHSLDGYDFRLGIGGEGSPCCIASSEQYRIYIVA